MNVRVDGVLTHTSRRLREEEKTHRSNTQDEFQSPAWHLPPYYDYDCERTRDGRLNIEEGWWAPQYDTSNKWLAYDLGTNVTVGVVCVRWGEYIPETDDYASRRVFGAASTRVDGYEGGGWYAGITYTAADGMMPGSGGPSTSRTTSTRTAPSTTPRGPSTWGATAPSW